MLPGAGEVDTASVDSFVDEMVDKTVFAGWGATAFSILPACWKAQNPRPAHHCKDAEPAGLAAPSAGRSAQLLAIGKPSAGNPGIGGDAIAADIHVSAARSQTG